MGIRATWERGLVTVARWHGGAVRVHASMLLAVPVAFISPFLAGFMLSLVGLIIFHELGHAVAVKLCGGKVKGIDLAPVAGICWYEDTLGPSKKTFVAWGGVAAQVLLFVAGLLAVHFVDLSQHPYADALAVTWLFLNPMLAFLNLLPVDPLDGFQAWKGLQRTVRRAKMDHTEKQLGLNKPRTDEVLRVDALPDELQKAVDAAVASSSGSKTPAFPITPRDGSMRN